jgi:hypothetical protein
LTPLSPIKPVILPVRNDWAQTIPITVVALCGAINWGDEMMFSNPIRQSPTALTIGAMLATSGVTAGPVLADQRSDDIAKGIIGIFAFGAIVNAINNQYCVAPAPAPKPIPMKKPLVPAECAIEFDTDQGQAIVYSRNCLTEVGFVHALPDCGRAVRIWGERGRVYSAQCLRRAGFRM